MTDVGVERPGKKGGKFNFTVNFIPIHHSFFLKARFNDEIVSARGVIIAYNVVSCATALVSDEA